MKALLMFGILVSSAMALAANDGDDSINSIIDIQTCAAEAKVAVVTMKDQSTQIRTVSPLGRPRLWSLEKDFTKNNDGSYENGFLSVHTAGGKITSVRIKNLTSSFNCSK